LHDIGVSPFKEPFKKMVNQGLIQGRSNFVYRLKSDPQTFVSQGLLKQYDASPIHVHVELVENDILDVEGFRAWKPEYKNVKFLTEKTSEGHEIVRCGWAVEKMSKSFFNVVNPDSICEEYGADTLRLFEMFLGPLEQFKPWNTQGIEGVSRFLQKLWRWTHENETDLCVNNDPVPEASLRLLHQTIDKITKDIDSLNFNTCVSQFMICVNEFAGAKVRNRDLVKTFTILLSPFAPHIAEELWEQLGEKGSVNFAPWPKADPKLLVASTMKIVIQVNGKLRADFETSASADQESILAQALAHPEIQKLVAGKEIKKKIYVPKKLVNLVV